MLLLLGCGTIVVDDVTVMENDYLRSRALILDLAESELGCPRAALTTKVLSVTVHANIRTMQVSGCDKTAVYARSGDSFARAAE